MDTARFHLVSELFEAALELSLESRVAFLDERCDGDADLRREVEDMLGADPGAGHLMESILSPFVGSGESGARGELAPGTWIGPCQIQRVLSSGGMGVVYEAIQENPRRTVAVKVLREGIASASALRRFEHESQILGRLRHPGIAQVFEAGTHDAGRATGCVPYFVMEFIPDARTLTDYACEKQLSTAERLGLFTQICDAVQHGHQKGIIHRDLKPGNILVDASGRAKVIDFGVARATDSDVALTTVHTAVGQLIGTLQYMSPEQCQGDPDDLDVRSDVYSLGVVLHELLCAELPYEVQDLPILEAVRRIREEPPARPSTVLRSLRGDVETIVLKTLEKDRSRRYQSADQLRRDIECYLAGEPIAARPPSVVYQLSSFARRHRTLVAGLATVFIVLFAGVVVSTSLFLEAESARAQSVREAERAQAINDFFTRMLVSLDPMQLHIGSGFGPYEELTPVPTSGYTRDASVAEMLRWAAPKIGETFAGKPELEARVRETIGSTYFVLGLYQDARPQLEAALAVRRGLLGEDHEDTLRSKIQLGNLLRVCGEYAAVEELLRPALEDLRRVHGELHRDTQTCATVLAVALCYQWKVEEGDALFEQTLATQRRALGNDDRQTLWTMCEWAFDLGRRKLTRKGEALAVEAFEHSRQRYGLDDYVTVFAEGSLGAFAVWRGEYSLGETTCRRALEKRCRMFGEHHPRTSVLRCFLAWALRGEATLAERLQLFRDAVSDIRLGLGETHHWMDVAMGSLGDLLADFGRYDELEELLRERHLACRAALGDQHAETIAALEERTSFLLQRGRAGEGERLYHEWLDSCRQEPEDDGPGTLTALGALAAYLRQCGEHRAAGERYRELVDRSLRALGDSHRSTLEAMAAAAAAFDAAGDPRKAGEFARNAVAGWRRRTDTEKVPAADLDAFARFLLTAEPGDVRDIDAAVRQAERAVEQSGGENSRFLATLARAYRAIGDDEGALGVQREAVAALSPGQRRLRRAVEDDLVRALLRSGDVEAAEQFLDERMARRREQHGEVSAFFTRPLVQDALLLVEEGWYPLAEPIAREALALLRRLSAGDPDWRTARAKALHGRCLAGLGRHEEAEPLLLQGYEEIGDNPLVEAVQARRQVRAWIVELYRGWGRPDQANEYLRR